MAGGTTFHFVTEGIEAALQRARAAAEGKDIKIGGGVETVRRYCRAGHVDEIHLADAPVVLGRGEVLFAGIELRSLGYRTTVHVPTERSLHPSEHADYDRRGDGRVDCGGGSRAPTIRVNGPHGSSAGHRILARGVWMQAAAW